MSQTFKQEFEEFVEEILSKKSEQCYIYCSVIHKVRKDVYLKPAYKNKDYKYFLKRLDFKVKPEDIFNYYGTIWFSDGSWADYKHDYDWDVAFWVLYERPEIPSEMWEKK